MSLLDRSPSFEPCVVYPEVTRTDEDGNTITKASTEGINAVARFQIQGQSGTSSRLAEQEDEGFSSERVYTVRFPNSFTAEHGELGAQAVIEWGLDSQGRPARYQIFGDAQRYGSSRRTRHVVYTIKRT
ncbi:hypothetical protein [Mycobacterium intracellulare]|uniref:Head-to-tail stopper n=1 Tax=Mycobacterium intracellulare TaxID=1767 RepID=A0A7R7MYV9_MYCIT|nr:hypothetical protein [Mycobacterium intracellulare]BCP02521.1 hypothetical protein MINTM018_52900 [Mycobacterium intracellulare]BCP36367.1 hypothetical protein MINTMi198_17370 [Mycobacterium intracellulare M.i.198]